MRNRSLELTVFAAAAGVWLTASSASAHIDLLEPPARAHGTAAAGDTDVDANTNQKTGPCGQATNGRNLERVTTYAPGETITVRVAEETNHDSYLRVSLDLDGDDDFVQRAPVAPATSIPPETQEVAQAAEEALDSEHLLNVTRELNTMNGFVHEIQVTLPDETCENCTLQVIQLMYDTGQIYYFQCADLVIAEGGGVSSDAGVDGEAGSANAGEAGAAGAGGAPGSGTGGARAGAGNAPPPATAGRGGAGSGGRAPAGSAGSAVTASDDEDDGGCTISTHAAGGSSAGLFSLLALGLGLVIRRRR